MTRHEPKPVDEGLPPPETRGGNRPEDYMPLMAPNPFAPLDIEEAFDDDEPRPTSYGRWGTDEPFGGNDPEAQ
jgi:hypothetical protein